MSIQKLKSFSEKNNLAVLITSEENIKYYTGFSTSNGFIIVNGESAFFFTDSRYIEAAAASISSDFEVLQTVGFEKTIVPFINNLSIKKTAIEAEKVTLSQFEFYKKVLPSVEFETTLLDAEIRNHRAVKNQFEIDCIEKARRIAELAFEHILTFIKAGVTEKEIRLELDYTMLKNGAEALSFETIVVAGENGSKPHGVPGDNVIKNGDFVTMDFGAVFKGYHSDMTRTVAVGSVTQKQLDVYNTVLKAQLEGLSKIKAGAACKDVDYSARKIITDAGYGEYFGHSFGHGVGIEIHEYPNESPSSNSILESGNVVTAEPGIYIPGQFGVRIEDMVLVTDDGYYNFTKSKKELIIL